MLSHTILFIENEGTYHIINFFFIISCFSLHACLCSPFSNVLGIKGVAAADVVLFTKKTSHIILRNRYCHLFVNLMIKKPGRLLKHDLLPANVSFRS